MKKTGILINLVFFAVVMLCKFSGNDKAPYLVLLASGISLLISIALLIKRQWKTAALTAIPFIYTVTVIILSRNGFIDSQVFLGFR